jgi:hypothetical protein
MRKRLALERPEQDLNIFLEDFAVGVLIHQRRAEGLDFARVAAAADAKDDPPAGQYVGHRVILGQPQRVPHRHDVEPQPIFRCLVMPHRCIAAIKLPLASSAGKTQYL